MIVVAASITSQTRATVRQPSAMTTESASVHLAQDQNRLNAKNVKDQGVIQNTNLGAG
jgi:hypothetical protein